MEGVVVIPLKQIPDERGKVMHMLRCDHALFEKFGEIYFSVVYPGKIKAWHLHKKMILNYAVPSGKIKLVLYDEREKSSTKGAIEELIIGDDNYCLVKIPPGIWNGFQGIDSKPAVVANCATLPYDPEEIVRIEPFSNKVPYEW